VEEGELKVELLLLLRPLHYSGWAC
jgi:hypothetical protein